MAIFFHCNDSFIFLTGKTYPLRDTLRGLGAQFLGDRKLWQLPLNDQNLAMVTKICLNAGGGKLNLPQSPTPTVAPLISPEPEVAEESQLAELSVSALMERVNQTIRREFKELVWVVGEIHNISQRQGAVYFQLSETLGEGQNALAVSATIWKGPWEKIKAKLGENVVQEIMQEGQKVRFLCQVQLYKGRGQISLMVFQCDPSYTKGQQALQREMLIKELRAAGLYEANKRRPIPAIPMRIGLLTAPNSRAYGDFMDQLQTARYPGTVVFYPSAMQGAQTIPEVIEGIHQLSAARCDLIIMTRGGGSQADLRWFDAKEIAFAIAQAKIPVIAAIGHHDDHCVAEEICYQRRKTPTAAADFIGELFLEVKTRLARSQELMGNQLTQKLVRTEKRLGEVSAHWNQLVSGLVERWHSFLTLREARLEQACHLALLAQGGVLDGLEKRILANDPRPWLSKGWTQLSKDGLLLTSVGQVQAGDKVHARLLDGEIQLEVL